MIFSYCRWYSKWGNEEKRREEKRREEKTRQDKTRQDKTRQDKTRQEEAMKKLYQIIAFALSTGTGKEFFFFVSLH